MEPAVVRFVAVNPCAVPRCALCLEFAVSACYLGTVDSCGVSPRARLTTGPGILRKRLNMSADEIELLKIQLQRDQLSAQREAARSDLFKWFVAFAWPLVVSTVTTLINHNAIGTVADKADKAATAATEAAAVAVETKQDQGEKLTAIVGGVDAGVKSWKAYQTKEPEDMHAAEEAISKAESIMP